MSITEINEIIRKIEFDNRISDATYNCYTDLIDMIKNDIRKAEEIQAEARVEEAKAELHRMNREYIRSVI